MSPWLLLATAWGLVRLVRSAPQEPHWLDTRQHMASLGLGARFRVLDWAGALLLGSRTLFGHFDGLPMTVHFSWFHDHVVVALPQGALEPVPGGLQPQDLEDLVRGTPSLGRDGRRDARVRIHHGRRRGVLLDKTLRTHRLAALVRRAPERTLADGLEVLLDAPLHPSVVVDVLLALRDHAPDRSRRVAEGQLGHADPLVRLEAALLAGEEGVEPLLRLATDRKTPEAIWRRAATATLQGPDLAVHARRVLADAPFLRRIEAVRALGTESSGPGRALLRARLDDPEAAVRREAARALVRVGSVGEVEALLDARQAHRLDALMVGWIDRAVATIQARLQGAEAGQLAMTQADRDTGQLSVAEAPGGQLSVAREPDGA